LPPAFATAASAAAPLFERMVRISPSVVPPEFFLDPTKCASAEQELKRCENRLKQEIADRAVIRRKFYGASDASQFARDANVVENATAADDDDQLYQLFFDTLRAEPTAEEEEEDGCMICLGPTGAGGRSIVHATGSNTHPDPLCQECAEILMSTSRRCPLCRETMSGTRPL